MLRVEFFERWGLAIALGSVVVLFVAYRAFLGSDSVKASLPELRAAAEQAEACRERGGEPINQMGPDLFCIKKECVSQ